MKQKKHNFLQLFKEMIGDSVVTKDEMANLEQWFRNIHPPLKPPDVEILMQSIIDHFRCRVASGDLNISPAEAINVTSRIWQRVWLIFTAGKDPLLFPYRTVQDADLEIHFRQRWAGFNKEVKEATRTLDIAVYNLTDDRARNLIKNLAQKDVTIRIFSEGKNTNCEGSDIDELAQINNIEVRLHKTLKLMHHKFVIIDQKTVLSGSMNFSSTGFSGNKENFLVTRHADIATVYTNEFEMLWDQCLPLQ